MNDVGAGIAIGKIAHVAHSVIGVIELTNYSVDWAINGCSDIDERDWIRRGVCAAYAHLASYISADDNLSGKTEL